MTRNSVAPTRRLLPSGTPSTRISTGPTLSRLLSQRLPRPPRFLPLPLSPPPVRSRRRPRSASTTRRRQRKRRLSANARRRRRRPLRRPRRRRGRARQPRPTANLTEQLQPQRHCLVSIMAASQQHHVVVRPTSDVHQQCVCTLRISLYSGYLLNCSIRKTAYGSRRFGIGMKELGASNFCIRADD